MKALALCLTKERALLDKSCIMNKWELCPSLPDQLNSLLLICKSNNASKTNPLGRLSSGAWTLLLRSLFVFITSVPAPRRAGLRSPVRKWAGELVWEWQFSQDGSPHPQPQSGALWAGNSLDSQSRAGELGTEQVLRSSILPAHPLCPCKINNLAQNCRRFLCLHA